MGLRAWWQKRQRREALARVRRELSFWGVDTTEFTDAELEEGILAIQRAVKASGIRAEEATNSMNRMMRLLKEESVFEEQQDHRA
ncbi:hypothetical protein LCGC14_0768660 [marine sediment metagenome]|uniref:Uncharacterized protein n=1 Tax=marine sediment metagenome TaxID=412755 RepID=A0A0F9T5X9_9ZZZZ